jgi:hypothetical protein
MHAMINACMHALGLGPSDLGAQTVTDPPIAKIVLSCASLCVFFPSSTALRIAPVATRIATRRQDASHKPSDEDSLVQCN